LIARAGLPPIRSCSCGNPLPLRPCLSRPAQDPRNACLFQPDSGVIEQHRSLGVGAGALALFCAMGGEKRRAVLRVNRNWMAEYWIGEQDLQASYDAYRANGYAANIGRIVAGTSAVAGAPQTADISGK